MVPNRNRMKFRFYTAICAIVKGFFPLLIGDRINFPPVRFTSIVPAVEKHIR